MKNLNSEKIVDQKELKNELSLFPQIEEAGLIRRESYLDSIDQVLYGVESKWPVICGLAGLGKTVLCAQYAQELAGKCGQIIVVWFNAASKETIEHVYYTKFGPYFKIDKKNHRNDEDFIWKINKKLDSLIYDFLFIFDNLTTPVDTLNVFTKDLNPKKFKIIITSSKNISETFQAQSDDAKSSNYENFNLKSFNEKETFEYFKLNLRKEDLKNKKLLKEFYKYFETSTEKDAGVLPLVLKTAVLVFNENGFWHVCKESEMRKATKSEVYLKAATNLKLNELDKESVEYKLLLYMSHLEGAFIAFDFILEIFKTTTTTTSAPETTTITTTTTTDRKVVNECLKEMSRKGLVSLVRRESQYGVSMHEAVQEALKDPKRGEQEQSEVLHSLLKLLDQLTPNVGHGEREQSVSHWEKVESYLYEHLIKLVTATPTANVIEMANLNFKLAQACQHKFHDAKKSLDYHLKSLQIRRKIQGERHADVAAYTSYIAGKYQSIGDYKSTLEYFTSSLKLSKEIYGGEKNLHVADILNSLGVLYATLSDGEKAVEFYTKSLEIRKALEGEKNARVAQSLSNLGDAQKLTGNYEKALECHLTALAIRRELYGEKNADVIDSLNSIALVYTCLGQTDQSLDIYIKVLDARKQLYGGEKHAQVAAAYNSIATAYKVLGNANKSLEFYLKELKLLEDLYDTGGGGGGGGGNSGCSAELALSLNNVGEIYRSMGSIDKALECHLRSLDVYRQVYGETHPNMVIVLSNLSHDYQALDKKKESNYYSDLSFKMKQLINQGIF